MSKGKFIWWAGAVVIGAVVIWQQITIGRLERQRAFLLDDLARQSTLQEQKANALGDVIDPAELERLRNEQAELLRLRNEVAQLRRQARENSSKAAAPAVGTAAPDTKNEMPVPPIQSFTASNHVTLAWKQALVTGGWRTESGKRTFFFIQPEPKASDTDPQLQILITARIVEIQEPELANFGLESLASDSREGMCQAVYSDEQYQALVKTMKQAEGVNIVSQPRIATSDGVAARLHVGGTLELPSGERIPIGTSMEVSPTLSPDGSSVVLSISSEIRKPSSGNSAVP